MGRGGEAVGRERKPGFFFFLPAPLQAGAELKVQRVGFLSSLRLKLRSAFRFNKPQRYLLGLGMWPSWPSGKREALVSGFSLGLGRWQSLFPARVSQTLESPGHRPWGPWDAAGVRVCLWSYPNLAKAKLHP